MGRLNLNPSRQDALNDLMKTAWFQGRPEVIKRAIETRPPVIGYWLDDKGYYIVSYHEPESGKLEDVTVTIRGNGKYKNIPPAQWPNAIHHSETISGVKLTELEPMLENPDQEYFKILHQPIEEDWD